MDAKRTPLRLTEYSHGAGCGCKLSPRVLEEILRGQTTGRRTHPELLVGNDTHDDAAVLDLGNGTGLVSTTDFFMPIVDDPYQFGRIASANAISDVYAMGGMPLMALGILGWPIEKLGPNVAADVVRGSRDVCDEAGIPLAGGHSIDAPEPIYGLAVSGIVELPYLKRNSGAMPGDHVYLTKPLGIGVVTTAQKRGIARPKDVERAISWMTTLNRLGPIFARTEGVTAMTDVTGFGLLGHLLEIARSSNVVIELEWDAVPVLPWTDAYIDMDAIPGGTRRNWFSYGQLVGLAQEFVSYDSRTSHKSPFDSRSLEEQWASYKRILAIACDPQTSGGLLVCVSEEWDGTEAIEEIFRSYGLSELAFPIGKCYPHQPGDPYVILPVYLPDQHPHEIER